MAATLATLSSKDADAAFVAVNEEQPFEEVEAQILSFLNDPEQTELELPRLSTSQRRRARKIAEQHPHVGCGSFGFAAERRLHLFKKGADGASINAGARAGEPVEVDLGSQLDLGAAPPVSIKNTFIDDWFAPQDGEGRAEVMTRSMPVALPGGLLQLGQELQGGVAAQELPSIKEVPCSPGKILSRSTSASEGGEHGAFGRSCGSSPTPSIPEQNVPVLPVQPEDIKVRNTFVHFDDVLNPVDQRAVQSMPHGMFSERLWAERLMWEQATASALAATAQVAAAQAAAAAAAPAFVVPQASAPAPEPCGLSPGTEVQIEGLTKLPAFNGLSGTVQSVDEETGRYNVLLDQPVGGRQWAKVKADNLRPVGLLPQPHGPPPLFDDGLFAPLQPPLGFPPTPPAQWQERPRAAPLQLTALV